MEPTELARLRRVAGKQTTLLSHYGRKTGKPHEVTIWFVLDDDKLFIGTANVKRQWVRNVQKTPKIKLSIGGETRATLVSSQTVPSTNGRWVLFGGSTGCFDRSSRLGIPSQQRV
jgi:deazaflavin-dependent oxidoreductase (nitroreductase family)